MSNAWPEWWDWELELSPHLLKRMIDRKFTESDLRAMLHDARRFRHDAFGDRFVIECQHEGRPWEVVVELDLAENLLVVVTAFPLD